MKTVYSSIKIRHSFQTKEKKPIIVKMNQVYNFLLKLWNKIPTNLVEKTKNVLAVFGLVSIFYFIFFFAVEKPNLIEDSEEKVEVLEDEIKDNHKEIKVLEKENIKIEKEIKNPKLLEERWEQELIVENLLAKNNMFLQINKVYRLSNEAMFNVKKRLLCSV